MQQSKLKNIMTDATLPLNSTTNKWDFLGKPKMNKKNSVFAFF